MKFSSPSKWFGRKHRGDQLDPADPVRLRLELMGQALPASIIGRLAAEAAARLESDESVDPAVAPYVGKYILASSNRIETEQAKNGNDALLAVGSIIFQAGNDMRQDYGVPQLGDFIHDQTGLADGANATAARFLTEKTMGQAYYDMQHPPEPPAQ